MLLELPSTKMPYAGEAWMRVNPVEMNALIMDPKQKREKELKNDPSFIGMPIFLLDSFSLREWEY